MKIFRINLSPDAVLYSDQHVSINQKLGRGNITEIGTPSASDLPLDIDHKWHVRHYGFSVSATEALILQSHLHAWRQFLESDAKWGMFIDNAVIFQSAPDFQGLLQELEMDECDLCFPFDQDAVMKAPDSLRNCKIPNANFHEDTEYEPYLFGRKWPATIYFLSRKAAKELSSMQSVERSIEDELIYAAIRGRLNMFCLGVPWFRIAAQQTVTIHGREQAIREAIIANGSWTEDSFAAMRNLLAIISNAAEALEIPLVLQGGTHLAYIRHGKMIPWDDDVDLGIRADQLELFLQGLDQLEGLRWGKFMEGHSATPYYKIWLAGREHIAGYQYSFPFVDIWVYHMKGDDFVFLNDIVCPGSATKPLMEATFEGARFFVPHNSIECLDARYKDWKKMIRVYTWRHSFEDQGFYRLKTRIEVDENGRIAPGFSF